MYKKIILICGMPRSGTSWLGQIFDSSPDVAFRMEPLFAYKFKNIIDENSTKANIIKFFNDVYLVDDDFISQKENKDSGVYGIFNKHSTLDFLVIKTTRHHHLLQRYLDLVDDIEIVSIVRHPCAVISSWENTDREFSAKGCSIDNDWKSGACRKGNVGEFWGFDDWLSVTQQHLELSKKYSNFTVVEYTKLVQQPERVIRSLFSKIGIPKEQETTDFLRDCQQSHQENPYSVFKNKRVENAWKERLNNEIAEEIVKVTIDSGLARFLK